MVSAETLVADLRARGMRVWCEDDRVWVEPFDQLTAAEEAAMPALKPAILAYLRSETADPAELAASAELFSRAKPEPKPPESVTAEAPVATTVSVTPVAELPRKRRRGFAVDLNGVVECGWCGTRGRVPHANSLVFWVFWNHSRLAALLEQMRPAERLSWIGRGLAQLQAPDGATRTLCESDGEWHAEAGGATVTHGQQAGEAGYAKTPTSTGGTVTGVGAAVLEAPTVPIRPPLKWAGGKRWLVPRLTEFWRPHQRKRLVEPFCGGLAVTLSLLPRQALLNDINPHLVWFYSWLKRGFRVVDGLECDNREDLFYEHRARFNELTSNGDADSAEASALFYYLNRSCYNGLCRFNSRGQFNVPFGKFKRINYSRDFASYQRVFADWEFSNADFEAVPVGPDDFLYADPPYDVEFRSYSKEGFSWDDQVRLGEWLAKHRGPTVLSNQATERILSLYRKLGFTVRTINAPRKISCTGDRSPAVEVLAIRGLD